MMRRAVSLRLTVGLQTRLWLVVALAVIGLASTEASGLFALRKQTIDAAQADTSDVSRSLAEHARNVFQVVGDVLDGVRERVEADGLEGAARTHMQRVLTERTGSYDFLRRLVVIDATGHAVLSSDAATTTEADYTNDAFFRHHRETPGHDAFVGWPIRDGSTATWAVTVSRRLNMPDGSFAGVVVASVPTAFFHRMYADIDTGRHGVILLIRDDGVLVSRSPMTSRDEARDMRAGELFQSIGKQDNERRFRNRSIVDGIERFGSYHRVAGEPLIVMVGRSSADVLVSWRSEGMLHLAGLAVVLGLLCLMTDKLSRQIARAELARQLLVDSNARLAESEARMARANHWLEMAEEIAQVGHWHLDVCGGNVLTWSDEVYRIHGVDRQSFDLTLDSALAAYHPEDRSRMAATVARAVETGRPFEASARVIQPDGSVRHVLSHGLPRSDAAGMTTMVFGVFKDVSRAKQSEAALLLAHQTAEAANLALQSANRALEAMAMQDSLTGLFNRRHFDSTLADEFRRARGSATSLALIMFDVDQFKQFNDLYGHQAGDACLRAIADVIPPLLNRPGDTASRYGGEEIAVLLPGGTEESARALADRICAAVRGLEIAHACNGLGVVTVSAGVEALMPVRERDLSIKLVQRADIALYAAKRAGRDRVVVFGEHGQTDAGERPVMIGTGR